MTSPNPFAPPEAAAVRLAPFVTDASRKPFSAWLVQAVGLLFGLYLLWGLVTMTLQGATYRGPDGVRSLYLIDLALRLLFFVDLWYAVTGIGLRTRAGRWAGLVFIGLLFVALALGVAIGVAAVIKLHGAGTSATSGLAGIAVALGFCLFLLALLGAWFHAFGFSTRARAYFRVGVPTR